MDSYKFGKLVCRVDGFFYFTVKFLKDFWFLVGFFCLRVDFEFLDIWILILDKVIIIDLGVYICVVENMVGKVICFVKVIIEGTVFKYWVYIVIYIYLFECVCLWVMFV